MIDAGRYMDHQVAIHWSGFQYVDRVPRVFRKPVGKHAACRSGTEDEVVKGVAGSQYRNLLGLHM